MKTQTTGNSTEISLIVPSKEAEKMQAALTAFLNLAGHKVRKLNDEGDELHTIEEAFPDSHPGSRLRGLRFREELSQKAMADQLGIRQHHISEMEKGARSISIEMAKRIGETFNISYKVFL
jgi:DNA-binding XRE family transcriptional regulator